jgi:hypothetical protein
MISLLKITNQICSNFYYLKTNPKLLQIVKMIQINFFKSREIKNQASKVNLYFEPSTFLKLFVSLKFVYRNFMKINYVQGPN